MNAINEQLAPVACTAVKLMPGEKVEDCGGMTGRVIRLDEINGHPMAWVQFMATGAVVGRLVENLKKVGGAV